jgi:hypothetical protein
VTVRSRFGLLLVIGLGAVAGAVLPASLLAQVPVKRDTVAGRQDTTPTRVDTARARAARPTEGRDTIRVPLPPRGDTTVRNDTSRRGAVPLPAKPAVDSAKLRAKADSIKAPLAHVDLPTVLEIGAPRIFDRAALFATGAQTLSDLLSRVPGLTEFTAGWLGAPSAIASEGNFRKVRLFLDGLEIDPLNPRARGVAQPNDLPIFSLEEVRIERNAEEVRVYARSWRVDRTTPYSRADVFTGDQNTNLYRAFLGKRFSHGEVLQFAAEQFSTQPERSLPSSDGLNFMLRAGANRGPWSGDLFAQRVERSRGQWVGSGNSADNTDSLPGHESQRTTAYARLANGNPDQGRWVQLLASLEDFRLSPRESNAFLATANPSAGDSGTVVPDSTIFVSQYLLTGGLTYGPFRVSASERLRSSGGRHWSSPSARASLLSPMLSATLFAEGETPITPTRFEGTVRFSPIDRIAFLGTASRTGPGLMERLLGDTVRGRTIDEDGTYLPGLLYFFPGFDSTEVSRFFVASETNLRAEAGLRLGDVWVSGGMLRRAATTLIPPVDLVNRGGTKGTAVRLEGEATGRTFSVRGRLYKAINADAWAVAWSDTSGLYRPRYQTRSELFIRTNLLERFPKGNFGLLASLAHEYRSSTRFPLRGDTSVTVGDSRTLSFRLEIRVQTAVVSYQFRNLLQERYQLVPGLNMPRQTQFYGIRWDFWN